MGKARKRIRNNKGIKEEKQEETGARTMENMEETQGIIGS